MKAHISEDQLEGQIRDLAKAFGALRYHTLNSIGSEAGFPDDVIVKGDLLCLWELKSAAGFVSESQRKWLDALAKVRRIDVRVIRPADVQLAAEILGGRKALEVLR